MVIFCQKIIKIARRLGAQPIDTRMCIPNATQIAFTCWFKGPPSFKCQVTRLSFAACSDNLSFIIWLK